jgi:hypothetical protein
LEDLAAERYVVLPEVVRRLGAALDDALDAYAHAAKNEAMLGCSETEARTADRSLPRHT